MSDAGVVVRVCIVSGCHRSGRPMRSLVTIKDELHSIVASAKNSSEINTKPLTAKKARTGIACSNFLAAPGASPKNTLSENCRGNEDKGGGCERKDDEFH